MGAPRPELGEVLQGYRLRGLIASGGMGSVYEAVHEEMGRRAAVKILAPELHRNPELVSRFIQEAQIIGRLRHPHVVDIFDFVQTDDPPRVAIMMEFLDGEPLHLALQHRSYSPVEAMRMTLQLASALEVIHDAGIIHRDLKPQNVMVVDADSAAGPGPHVKLLDFGIAKRTRGSGARPLTTVGAFMGTPTYMAPEQIAGEDVVAATDLYALAEILFETVSGRPLFDAEVEQVLRMKMLNEIPDLTLADFDGSREISGLIQACLHPSPDARPSLNGFTAALRAIKDQAEGLEMDDATTFDPHPRSATEAPTEATEVAPPQAPGRRDTLEDRRVSSELLLAEPPSLEAEATTAGRAPAPVPARPVFVPEWIPPAASLVSPREVTETTRDPAAAEIMASSPPSPRRILAALAALSFALLTAFLIWALRG